MNLCILIGPFLLAIWYPQVGTLAALGGSFSTMLVCYLLPILTHIKFKYSSIRNPQVASLIKKSTVSVSPITSPKTSMIDSDNDNDFDSKKDKVKEKKLSVLEVMASD